MHIRVVIEIYIFNSNSEYKLDTQVWALSANRDEGFWGLAKLKIGDISVPGNFMTAFPLP